LIWDGVSARTPRDDNASSLAQRVTKGQEHSFEPRAGTDRGSNIRARTPHTA
jgi:hypothetical protein